MDGTGLCHQRVPHGAAGETQHCDGFPQAGMNFDYRHIGERGCGTVDGIQWVRRMDSRMAAALAEFSERAPALDFGGLDALACLFRPFF